MERTDSAHQNSEFSLHELQKHFPAFHIQVLNEAVLSK